LIWLATDIILISSIVRPTRPARSHLPSARMLTAMFEISLEQIDRAQQMINSRLKELSLQKLPETETDRLSEVIGIANQILRRSDVATVTPMAGAQ